MNTSQQQESIAIAENLEKALRREFESLSPLSKDCCIYRVPPRMRRLNERLYTPQVVSIGPIHHGREEFKAMEEHKRRYLQDFLQRTKVNMKEFLALVKDREAKLRGRYAEIIELGSKNFVKMILVDAAFIIELFLRLSIYDRLNVGVDRIFTNPRMISDIAPDLLKLENQFPLFILEDLFNLAKTEMHTNHYEGVSMIGLTWKFLQPLNNQFLLEQNLVETNFSKAEHFVDLIRLSLQPPELKPSENVTPIEVKTLAILSATELHQAGVKFEVGSRKNLFDISFKDGIMVIPNLKIIDESEGLFRNLQVFEILHCNTNYINDYITFINFLVNTRKDVEFLIHEGVIDNLLWDGEGVSTLFHNLVKEAKVVSFNFYYSSIVKDLKAYCKHPWHTWKANLKQNYFNTPWAAISIIAAVILLLLTVIIEL
ncbi:hypothetical protein Q3G72_013845 [Acer saccharum]|nr:hypothetical protein Q3G72_013845 [Acer saccharum]